MTDNQMLQGQRVLVVEDEYDLATDICEWLVDAGAKVVGPVRDAEQALEMLAGEAVDTAVVDINLGRGPSYDVAAELKRRSVPFLFATGYDVGAIPNEFQQAPRIEKPFKGTELVAAVKALTSAEV